MKLQILSMGISKLNLLCIVCSVYSAFSVAFWCAVGTSILLLILALLGKTKLYVCLFILVYAESVTETMSLSVLVN